MHPSYCGKLVEGYLKYLTQDKQFKGNATKFLLSAEEERPAPPEAEEERPAPPEAEEERPAPPEAEEERPAPPEAEEEWPAPPELSRLFRPLGGFVPMGVLRCPAPPPLGWGSSWPVRWPGLWGGVLSW
uniref:Uncharacterized protein n=1 Tax=Esox lucius TaxID=8010 RepID=A0AAY5KHS5_ESOLU